MNSSRGFNILIFLLLFSPIFSFGQQKPISAYFDYKLFYVPGEGRMIETYLKIDGRSTAYVDVNDSTTQAEVQIKLIISDDQKVVDFRKLNLKSPQAVKGYYPDFVDIQRFIIPKGLYSIELTMNDVNRPDSPPAELIQKINLTYGIDKPFFSDVELIAAYKKSTEASSTSKSGLDFIPYMAHTYSTDFNELLFYFELYNIEKEVKTGDRFLLKYYIEDLNHELEQEGCVTLSRESPAAVITKLARFDISRLRSGSYNLKLEARNRENELICDQVMSFVRVNQNGPELSPEEINLTFVGSINDKDSLIEYMNALGPISGDQELMIIDQYSETLTLIELKSFFYSFWETRNPINPAKAWAQYKLMVEQVEEKYGTRVKPGYRTDMGRVYLKYGPPNTVVDDANDSETYPFQIWHYYKADRFSEGRFVFYDESLLLSDYMLLHSDVPGERRNPRWNRILHGRNNAMNNFDQNAAPGESSRRVQELYDSPR